MTRSIIKKTVIITGYRCNNKCKFCISSNKRNLPVKTTQRIISEMYDARRRGRTYLEFIGGEQTIRKDCINLISIAKRIGFKHIAMATNGRLFAYREYTKKIIKAGITSVIFSIHGHNERLHDALTQVSGSLGQLLKGIENFKKLGFNDLGSNTTIVKQNYKYLPQIGELILNLGIRNSEFIFVDPTSGGARDNFKELVPRISEAAPYIKQCLDIGRRKKNKHWHIRYVPICLFTSYKDQISELFERKIFTTEHIASDFKNFDVEDSRRVIGRRRPEKCANCKEYDNCEGIWREYYKHYGDKELQPIART